MLPRDVEVDRLGGEAPLSSGLPRCAACHVIEMHDEKPGTWKLGALKTLFLAALRFAQTDPLVGSVLGSLAFLERPQKKQSGRQLGKHVRRALWQNTASLIHLLHEVSTT
jgi:hypothetical protein